MIDLHIHSNYSDGTNTIEELIDLIEDKNLKYFSLTDHDTVKGIEPITKLAKTKDIHVIPGIEISASVNSDVLHILGYNIDYTNSQLLEFLNRTTSRYTDITYKKLQLLNDKGILDYTWDKVIKNCGFKSAIYSSDVYKSMIADGYPYELKNWTNFCKNTFSKVSDCFPKIVFPSPEEVVEIILHSGGIPVFAHPKRSKDKDIMFINRLIKAGIKGLEVFYPFHDQITTEIYKDIAERYGLIMTGGTDWHGEFTTWNVEIGDFGVSNINSII